GAHRPRRRAAHHRRRRARLRRIGRPTRALIPNASGVPGWVGIASPVVIDVRLVRSDFDLVRAGLARRGDPSILESLDRVAALDVRLREVIAERDSLRATVKSLSKDVGALRREGKTAEAEAVQAESRALGERAAALDADHDQLSEQVRGELLVIP